MSEVRVNLGELAAEILGPTEEELEIARLQREVERLRAEKEAAPTCEVCGQRCDCTDGTHDNGVPILETRLRALLAEVSCKGFLSRGRCLRCEFEAALNSSTGQQNAPVVPEEFGNEGDAP